MKGATAREATCAALKCGYRHIDTASVYGNEAAIAEGIRLSGVPRGELFITSKVGPGEHGYESALAAFGRTVAKLQTDYLDLYLIHWPGVQGVKMNSPQNAALRGETWRALEALYAAGKCRAIGVSNYNIDHLTELLRTCSVPPMVNQLEYHPRFQRRLLRTFCLEHGIVFEAYSSFGEGRLLQDPVVLEVAAAVGKSPAQVLLRWALQCGIPVLPKSSSPARLAENRLVFDWALPPAQMQMLNNMDRDQRFCWDSTDVL